MKATVTENSKLLFFSQIQNALVNKYGFSSEAATTATQNFLKNFRKCPENVELPLHDWRQNLWEKSLGEANLKISGEIYCQWLNFRYRYIAPSSEVLGVLENLRKSYYLAVITNGPSNSQWEKIKRLRLSEYFDAILVSGDLEWEKPHENIFLEASARLGLAPQQCVMVGDKLETDILGGMKAGLGGTVWVSSPGSRPSSSPFNVVPDCIISDVVELKYIFSSKVTNDYFRSNRAGEFLSEKDAEDGNSNSSCGS